MSYPHCLGLDQVQPGEVCACKTGRPGLSSGLGPALHPSPKGP